MIYNWYETILNCLQTCRKQECFFLSFRSSSASAVCVFRLQDVRTAFSGRYRTFNMQTHLWSPLVDKHAHLGQVSTLLHLLTGNLL